MTPKDKIATMLEMQADVNKKLDTNYTGESQLFRSLWTYCAKILLDMAGHVYETREDFVTEINTHLFNLWITMLCIELTYNEPKADYLSSFDIDLDVQDTDADLFDRIEIMAEMALKYDITGAFIWFLKMLKHPDIAMTIDDLYVLYAGNYAFEVFKFERESAYREIWRDGRTGDEHLKEVVEAHRNSDDFMADVYADLVERYKVAA